MNRRQHRASCAQVALAQRIPGVGHPIVRVHEGEQRIQLHRWAFESCERPELDGSRDRCLRGLPSFE